MSLLCIGIDPGVDGAVAVVFNGQHLMLSDIPTVSRGKSRAHRVIDPAGLAKILQPFRDADLAVLESVSAMPKQGVSSVFSLGESLGCIRGVLGAMQIPVEMVAPARWKKHFGLTSDKELSRSHAINRFPTADLHRKKDHNRAEALLLALYGETLNK